MSPCKCRQLLITILVSILVVMTDQQECDVQLPDLIHVKETDPAGTELLTVKASLGTVWTYSLESPQHSALKGYFNFTPSDNKLTFILRLTRPLDLEAIKRSLKVNLDVLLFSLYCRSGKLSSMKYIVPLGVAAVNEFPPTFNTSRISLKVNETTPIGRNLLSLVDWSYDDDVNFSEREIYDFTLSANQSDSWTNALNWIHISNAYDGVLTLKRSLDYETLPENKKYLTTGVTVKDVGGLTGTAIVTLYVLDEDDLPPVFHFPGCMPPCSASYSADVSGNTTGVITDVAPGPIKATDGDALNFNITYSISQGPENFIEFFRINPTSGKVAIIQELEQTGLKVILLLIEAREVSPLKRSSKVTLLVTVRDGLMAHRAGYQLVIVIVIAIILFIAVIALTTGCLVWRMKYKSQVHSVVMQENSQDSVVIRADPFNGGHLNDHMTAKRDNHLQLDQTEPLKSMEIPSTKTNLRGDSIDVNFNQTSDFLPNVEQLETEYAEVDIDNTSQWQRLSNQAQHSYDKGHNDLAPPPAQYVDNLGYELPRSSHRPRTNFDPEGRTLAGGYTCRPLPVPTDTLDENPYATVHKMRSFFRNGVDDPEGAIVSKFKSPLVSNAVSIDVFDATRDYQELEVYFGSYTGTSSSGEMDRSVDVHDLNLDPRDNLYWTVVTDQDDDNLPERFPDSYV